MNDLLNTPLGRFRAIAFLEGLSAIFLFFVAMPLKYWAGLPLFVKYGGWAHGVLFLIYIVALLQVFIVEKWGIVKAILAFMASLIPVGTFVFDAKYLKK
jgi:integral membrane protein